MSRSTPTRQNILKYLKLHPNSTNIDISKAVGVSPSSTARALQFLHAEGEVHVSSMDESTPGIFRKRYSLGFAIGVCPPVRGDRRAIRLMQQEKLDLEMLKHEASKHAENPFAILIAQLTRECA